MPGRPSPASSRQATQVAGGRVGHQGPDARLGRDPGQQVAGRVPELGLLAGEPDEHLASRSASLTARHPDQ